MRLIFLKIEMAKLFVSCEDPDQTLRSVASDLGLLCLQITLLGSPDYNRLIVRSMRSNGTRRNVGKRTF